MCCLVFIVENDLIPLHVNVLGLSPIYTLQLAAKFGFQPRTLKPDNFGPPTLEKVQLSTCAVLQVNSTFDIFISAKILYYFFEHLNVLKWKNSKLQSCRSHRGLQFTYKNYLHPTSYWRVFYFLKFESHHANFKK